MAWLKANEKLPQDQQQVLIRENMSVHIAVYQAEQKAFEVSSGAKIPLHSAVIEWQDLSK